MENGDGEENRLSGADTIRVERVLFGGYFSFGTSDRNLTVCGCVQACSRVPEFVDRKTTRPVCRTGVRRDGGRFAECELGSVPQPRGLAKIESHTGTHESNAAVAVLLSPLRPRNERRGGLHREAFPAGRCPSETARLFPATTLFHPPPHGDKNEKPRGSGGERISDREARAGRGMGVLLLLGSGRFLARRPPLALAPRCSRGSPEQGSGGGDKGDTSSTDWDKAWSTFKKKGKKTLFSEFSPNKYVSWNPRRSEYPLSEEVDPIRRTERGDYHHLDIANLYISCSKQVTEEVTNMSWNVELRSQNLAS
uniref:Uncharacterized protein n=1 Tax=Leersia perrieri TaxID=77586 RepID=A0A0D9VSQ7_9ORYZ